MNKLWWLMPITVALLIFYLVFLLGDLKPARGERWNIVCSDGSAANNLIAVEAKGRYINVTPEVGHGGEYTLTESTHCVIQYIPE